MVSNTSRDAGKIVWVLSVDSFTENRILLCILCSQFNPDSIKSVTVANADATIVLHNEQRHARKLSVVLLNEWL